MTLNLDKSNWKRVSFGDVVSNLNVVLKDPTAAGIDRVIAMNHLDPGRLEISRWGILDEGTTFTRRVRPGQTLFGKRRAYQRKVAFAEFEAICSSDILVFEADEGQLLPVFLPFVVQSDGFYNYAVGTSAGSLSPRTNWRDLARFEFDLPPLDEQRRIASLLWAVEDESRAVQGQLRKFDMAAGLWTNQAFENSQADERPIGDVVEACQYGLSVRAGEDGAYPMLRMTNLNNGAVTGDDLKYCDLPDSDFRNYRLLAGDVLFNRTNSIELVGRSGIFQLGGEFVFASYLIRLRARKGKLLPEYLNAYINSPIGQKRIRVHASKGVSQANISGTNLKSVFIPVPGIDLQGAVVSRLESIQMHRREISGRMAAAAILRQRISREVFGSSA